MNNPDLQGSAVLVYDGAQPSTRGLMFDNQKLHGTPQLSDPQFQPITAAGQRWLIGIQLSRGQIGPSGITPGLWILVLSGVLTSAAAALVTQLLVASHSRTRAALNTAEAARNDLRLAAVVFEASPQAIVVTDPVGHVISANPGFTRVTGYSGTEILGRSLSVLKSGRHEPSFYTDLWDSVRRRGVWQGEIWNRVRSGEVRRQELSITAVLNQQLQTIHYVGMLQDVSERHQRQESIRHRSQHDPLTGLANRALLLENIEQALAAGERDGQSVGLILMDLDGFKPINDLHGHAIGDRVLQAVAQLVGARLRGSDTLARLGGDEFVVLLPRLSGSHQEVMMLCRRIREAVAAVQQEIGEPITLSVSLGIACSPEHGVTAGQLMAAADAAMYRANRDPEQPVQWAEPVT
ncbi:MAG: diguanylate cyclase domain-containing protein [Cyanobium sp.]